MGDSGSLSMVDTLQHSMTAACAEASFATPMSLCSLSCRMRSPTLSGCGASFLLAWMRGLGCSISIARNILAVATHRHHQQQDTVISSSRHISSSIRHCQNRASALFSALGWLSPWYWLPRELAAAPRSQLITSSCPFIICSLRAPRCNFAVPTRF